MRLWLVLPLVLCAAGCVDLSAITGSSPQAARQAPECGAIQMVTVADTSLPENARQFYPQVELTLSSCTE